MNNKEFVAKIVDVAKNYKTLYVMGCFGAPMTPANKTRYCNNHSYNKKAARQAMIKAATADTFGFDCVNLIKGVLWGWNGDKSKTYGGAKYAVNGVPDVSADGMIAKCLNVSTDFSNLEVGEAVWMPGHIGIYIGDGLAVECTPSWKNCVQITSCNCTKAGYNRRNWKKHGKLPYITYEKVASATTSTSSKKSVDEIAKEVMQGKWGVGEARKTALTKAGYNYSEVQAKVNALCSGSSSASAKKSVNEIAKEVIQGKWGNGATRKAKLTAAGYDYVAVQAAVNKLL